MVVCYSCDARKPKGRLRGFRASTSTGALGDRCPQFLSADDKEKCDAVRDLAARLKEQITDETSTNAANLMSNLLMAALSAVNWSEIAENWIDENWIDENWTHENWTHEE